MTKIGDGTSTCSVDLPQHLPDLAELASFVERMASQPRPIGDLFGHIVWLDPVHRTLRVGSNKATFPVDHPYIAGTALHAAALRALEPDAMLAARNKGGSEQ